MKLAELIIDPETGTLSHTKLWANIAYLAATVAFIKHSWATEMPSAELWLVYLGVVGTHGAASKLFRLKYGGRQC